MLSRNTQNSLEKDILHCFYCGHELLEQGVVFVANTETTHKICLNCSETFTMSRFCPE